MTNLMILMAWGILGVSLAKIALVVYRQYVATNWDGA